MKISFICDKCKEVKSFLCRTIPKEVECPQCQEKMRRQYSISVEAEKGGTSKERRCDLFNVNLLDDHEQILSERSKDHFWEVIVPELVSSGKYAVSDMLSKGWIYYNEKDEIVIQTKPLHRR